MNVRYVYLAGPITGTAALDAQEWRQNQVLHDALRLQMWEPLSPFDGILGYSQQDVEEEHSAAVPAWFEDSALGEGAALKAVNKDFLYITHASAVLANFTGASHASIGSCVELGYAYGLGKPIISVIESEDNIHYHPFPVGVSVAVVPTLEAAVVELQAIGRKLTEPPYA